MEDLTGKQFGPYRIVAPLGEGGMAAVYRAYQPSVDRYVALKVLPRYFASDPEFIGRFKQEARTLARLQHPRILTVHDSGESDGYTYIVMPFVDTGTLSDLLVGKPLSLSQIARIISQLADALDYAHGLGVVHRDIKPSNILIDSQGNCLLTDFGIAKVVEGTSQFTRTGGTIGTPAYMSPEQIQGEQLDGRSDIYSLGIMLYEMATGRPPFRAETPPAVFVKHLHDPLPPPNIYNPDIPEGVERVILKSLAKDRSDRFQSAAELANALDQAIAGEPLELAGVPTVKRMLPTEAVPITRPPVERRRPKWLLPALGGIAAIVILIVALLLFSNRGGKESAAELPTATGVSIPVAVVVTEVVPEKEPGATREPTPIPPTEAPRPTPTPVPAAVSLEAPRPPASDPWGQVIIPPDNPIRLAFVGALSGEVEEIGRSQLNAFIMAVESAGELYGFPFDSQASFIGDGGCSEVGVDTALVVAEQGDILGVIGHTCSSSCDAAIPVYEEAHLVSISPSCTLPELSKAGSELFNRVAVRDDQGGEEFRWQINESGEMEEFAVLYQERFGEPLERTGWEDLVANTFDATNVLIQAVRATAGMDDRGNLVISRQALARAVRNTNQFVGISGEIAFSARGDRLVRTIPEGCLPGELLVGLVTDELGVGASDFNTRVWDGLLRADADLAVCARIIESTNPESYERSLVELAEQNYDLIVAAGFQMDNATYQVAQRYPGVKFAIIDRISDPPLENVQGLYFAVDQAAFEAGYLASAWAELQDPDNPQVGFIGGMEIPSVQAFMAGYESGVAYYNQEQASRVEVKSVFTGNFDQPQDGERAAIELVDQGVDVIFAAAGETGNGALLALRDLGRWGIGVDSDQYQTFPLAREIILTSVEKRVDPGVYLMVEHFYHGEFFGGGVFVGNLENDAVGLAPFYEFGEQIPPPILEDLELIRDGIIGGAIQSGY